MDAITPARPGSAQGMYGVAANDPTSRLLDRTDLTEADVEQISRLMQALGDMRSAERIVSDASARYMELNETDMRALHYLIVCANQSRSVTAGQLAKHLAISPATTTKLLDRMEKGGHITRSTHPHDRRALQICITAETREAAYETVGRLQSRRFHAAARLTPAEREIVISFLEDMTSEIDLKNVDWASNE